MKHQSLYMLNTKGFFIFWTECVFRCKNSKCLYAEEDLCNGIDDCGDKTDETEPCSKLDIL